MGVAADGTDPAAMAICGLSSVDVMPVDPSTQDGESCTEDTGLVLQDTSNHGYQGFTCIISSVNSRSRS